MARVPSQDDIEDPRFLGPHPENVKRQEADKKSRTDKLRGYIKSIEAIEAEVAGLKSDLKAIYDDAKLNSFSDKVIKAQIKRRKKDRAEVQTEDALLSTYERAVDEPSEI